MNAKMNPGLLLGPLIMSKIHLTMWIVIQLQVTPVNDMITDYKYIAISIP